MNRVIIGLSLLLFAILTSGITSKIIRSSKQYTIKTSVSQQGIAGENIADFYRKKYWLETKIAKVDRLILTVRERSKGIYYPKVGMTTVTRHASLGKTSYLRRLKKIKKTLTSRLHRMQLAEHEIQKSLHKKHMAWNQTH